MKNDRPTLETLVSDAASTLGKVLDGFQADLTAEGIGVVRFLGNGIALVDGLPGVKSEELVRFPGNLLGMAFNVDPAEVGVILLGKQKSCRPAPRSAAPAGCWMFPSAKPSWFGSGGARAPPG